MKRQWLWGMVVVVLLAAVVAMQEAPDDVGPDPGVAPSPRPTTTSALEVARTLEVAPRGPFDGYHRAQFGDGWVDVDGNGCSTRNDVLARDLVDVRVRPNTGGCVVAAGILHDPYTGAVMAFEHGPDTSPLVQIDHVVALADAWRMGAREWDEDQRIAFANDPLNLLAVDGDANQDKGSGNVAMWLPTPDYWCPYAARVVAVKEAYELAVTAAESERLVEILQTCPTEPLP